MQQKLFVLKAMLVGAVLAASAPVMAEPVTVTTTDVVAQLGIINTTTAAIGTALLVAAAIAVCYKWAKAGIFG